MKTLTKLDIIIILLLLVLSFTPNLIFYKKLSNSYTSYYANIKIGGKLHDNINLSSFNGEKTFKLSNGYNDNIILVKNNTIKITDANCKDKLCIKQGAISNVGENLICLPNEVIIEIKGEEKGSPSDDMILSH